MKKINVFRSMLAVVIFTVLASTLSGCFYSPGYGYGRPYAYNRPYRRVYVTPPPPPVRYQSHHRHYYDNGRYYNNSRARSYNHGSGYSRGHRR